MATRPTKKALYATPEAADQLSNEWTDEVLACRSGLLRHVFEPWTVQENKKLRYFYIVTRCKTCGTLRHCEMNYHGAILGSAWYTYPPGYLAKGIGRIKGEAQDVIRVKAVRRLFEISVLTPREAKEDTPRPTTLTLLQGGAQ